MEKEPAAYENFEMVKVVRDPSIENLIASYDTEDNLAALQRVINKIIAAHFKEYAVKSLPSDSSFEIETSSLVGPLESTRSARESPVYDRPKITAPVPSLCK